MNWESLAVPFITGVESGNEHDVTDVLAQQNPETGGTDTDTLAAEQDVAEDDEPEGFDAVNSEQQEEVREKLSRAATFNHRLSQHCESLRQKSAAMVPSAESVADIEADLDIDTR